VNWYRVRPWLGTVVRLVLGAVWIWASLSKLHNPRRFVQDVRAYDATPEWLSKGIGYGLPVLEVAIGVLLIVGIAVRLSAIASAALFLVFLVGLVEASARGIKLSCGCFGGGGLTDGSTQYTWEILRDIGLLALAVLLALWPLTYLSIETYLARHDYVDPPSPKRMRTEAGSRKYTAQVEAKRKAARERALYINSSLAIVVVLIALIGVGVQAKRAKITGTIDTTNATAANGVTFGKPAAATVDIYEDFQCPNCLNFETATHTTLEADARANKAQLRYHTMSFLDSSSNGNRYSSRAANAALCAADVSPDLFLKFHDILFTPAVQPKEGSNGRPDSDFVKYAQQAGMTAAQVTTFTSCVQTDQHKSLVEAITENASKRGVTGTPTVYVNGKKVDATSAAVTAAIAAADAKGPKPSPSVTPSPSSSSSGTAAATGSPTPSK
jgi:protein-disulfide isomerase